MAYPEDVRYTSDHEWAREEGGIITIGITSYATEQLGDVVFVELPEVGRVIEMGRTFGVVEAVKTVSDLYAPLSGEVVEVNVHLSDNAPLVNQDPFGDGWMIKLKMADKSARAALMTADAYKSLLGE